MIANLGTNLLAAIIFAALGIAVFALAFVALDRLTPYDLWKELVEEHNVALGLVVGLSALGISIIVAAAIH